MNLKAKSRGLYWLGAVLLVFCMAAALLLSMGTDAEAKGDPSDQTVGTVFMYLLNDQNEQILVSQNSVNEMYNYYLENPDEFHFYNYSILDKFVTPVHQEASGFTVLEFVKYALANSTDEEVRSISEIFEGEDQISFWEMDDTQFDDVDTYTYEDMYGVKRYNFPALYEYWNFTNQTYTDVDAIWESGEEVQFLLSVVAFSQRFIDTDEKYNATDSSQSDFDMENLWTSQEKLDTQRTVRLMVGMTEQELYAKTSTAHNARYWICDMLMKTDYTLDIESKGTVKTPTYYIVDGDAFDDDQYESGYYYYFFECEDEFANLYYNHNLTNQSYMPTEPYENDGEGIKVQKYTKVGDPNITYVKYRAVADGYQDAGVQQAKLASAEPALMPADSYSITAVSMPLSYSANVGTWIDGLTLTLNGKVLSSSDYSITQSGSGYTLTISPNVLSEGTNTLKAESTTSDQSRTVTFKTVNLNKFTDVDQTAWYKNAVYFSVANNLFVGTNSAGTTWEPDTALSRAMFVTVLGKYSGVSNTDYASCEFDDVANGQWYTGFVQWAYDEGLVVGTGGGNFSPNDSITRQEMAVIFWKYVNKTGADMSASSESFNSFADKDATDSWAVTALTWATDRGIINGSYGNLLPKDTASRAQAAQIFMRIIQDIL